MLLFYRPGFAAGEMRILDREKDKDGEYVEKMRVLRGKDMSRPVTQREVLDEDGESTMVDQPAGEEKPLKFKDEEYVLSKYPQWFKKA